MKTIYYTNHVRNRAMKVIRALEENLIELANLQKRYMEYHQEIDAYFAFNESISELWIEYMKKVIRDKDQVVYCAFVEDRIVGYMTAATAERPPIYRIGKTGLIGDAFVLADFRKQGVFSRLLEKTLDWLRRKGVAYVEHPVASGNQLGLKVWRSKGFDDYMIFMRKKI